MRLLCPFCQRAITVPDADAGKAVPCPLCGQTFAAPELYAPPADVYAVEKPPRPPPPVKSLPVEVVQTTPSLVVPVTAEPSFPALAPAPAAGGPAAPSGGSRSSRGSCAGCRPPG